MKQLLLAWLVCVYSAGVLAGDVVDMGVAEFKAGKYRTALKHLRAPAEAGNAQAQLYMGRLYAGGRAGVMDDFEAANWFEKAAIQNNAAAQYQLGRLYLSGWGLSKDPEAAMGWLWKSGRLGFLKSQLLLGKLLSEGKDVPQDIGAARLWYAQAASQGSVKAHDELEKLGGAEALPDGGEGLKTALAQQADEPSADTEATPQTEPAQLDSESRAAIVKRRIAELKAARKGANSVVAAVAVGTATAVVIETVAESADQGVAAVEVADLAEDDELMVLEEVAPDTAMDANIGIGEDTAADSAGSMEVDELVLEEFVTDDTTGVDEVLELDVATVDAVAEPVAEPVVDQVEAPVEQPVPQADSDGLQGHAWVLSRDPTHYTIQLLGSWKRADALAFVEANPLPGVGALVETRRRGKPWFSLYYGDLSSYSNAVARQSSLSGGIVKHGPWVRPFRKIQAGLK